MTTNPALRLGVVVIISMALHWLLLTTGTERPAEPVTRPLRPLMVELRPQPPEKPLPATPLAMPIPAPQQPQQPQQQQPAATRTIAATAVPVATPVATRQTVAIEPPAPVQHITASHTTTANPVDAEVNQPPSTAAPSDHWQGQIRNSLNADISRHFRYPRQARQRNWEGTVLLTLLIEIDGRISRITLAESSGYALLDNNAIATLTRIGSVSGAQQWPGGQSLELPLPVTYRLSDS